MGERRVRWTETARRNLEAIVGFIAEDSIENALTVLDRLEEWVELLEVATDRGGVIPELRALDVHQYRGLIERPWHIVYRIEANRVVVLAVLDGRRDLRSLLLERLPRQWVVFQVAHAGAQVQGGAPRGVQGLEHSTTLFETTNRPVGKCRR